VTNQRHFAHFKNPKQNLSHYLIVLHIKWSFHNYISGKQVKLGRLQNVKFFLIPSKIQGNLLPKHIVLS